MEALGALCSPFRQVPNLTSVSHDLQIGTNLLGRSAKPLCVGSIPTRASNLFNNLRALRDRVE